MWELVFVLLCFFNLNSEPLDLGVFDKPPLIDGVISPEEWTNANLFNKPFIQIRPDFGKEACESTVVMAGYDKENIYFLFDVRQDTSTFFERKGTRDNAFDQDAVGIFVDPIANRKELFMIIVGLSGNVGDFRKVRSDLNGTQDITWDANLETAVSKNKHGYIVEMKIPLSNFRRQNGSVLEWNINFYRKIRGTGMQCVYSPIKEFSNDAEFEALFPVSMINFGGRDKVEITPYGIFGAIADSTISAQGDAGFDIKAPFNNSGVFNFAFNPDYSQIEGDPLSFNYNSKYAIYYSEYRPFFVEERNVFETENEIYYSRAIQNPFIAGRYTHKENSYQTGVIVAYDKEDTAIGNTDALASVFRFSKQQNIADLGIMALSRYDFEQKYNNILLMQNGSFNFSEGNTLKYVVSAYDKIDSSLNISTERLKNQLMYKADYILFKNDWALILEQMGVSDSFDNDLGYVTITGKHLSVAYIQREFRFTENKINAITLSLQGVLIGSFDKYSSYISSDQESLEYQIEIKYAMDFVDNGYMHLIARNDKELWNDRFLNILRINSYAQKNLTKYLFWDFALNGGGRVDYNYTRVGKYSSGASNFYYTPFPEITLNTGVSFDCFYADTSKYAVSTDDIGSAVYQWKVYACDGGVSYNPSNQLSLKFIFQKQFAYFAPGYYMEGEYSEKDEKLFLITEYKPTVGNVIYIGARYPEKLFFFKFSHRFTV